jgi:hypothetical protein
MMMPPALTLVLTFRLGARTAASLWLLPTGQPPAWMLV